MKKTILALLSSLIILSSCSNKVEENDKTTKDNNIEASEEKIVNESKIKSEAVSSDLNKYEVTLYDYFDTITTFSAYTKDENEYKKYKKLVETLMNDYHKYFNSYEKHEGINNIYTINVMAGKEAVKVDKVIIDLIKEGLNWYEATDGVINIAEGSVLKIWTDFRNEANANPEKAKLPESSILEEAGKHVDINAIEINEEESTVFIKDKYVQLDVGAIGKGYATELIKRKLIEEGLEYGILSVGGDVAIVGDNPLKESRKYSIAIQNPYLSDSNPYSSIVDVVNTSVVTSGDYQRYFEIDGRKYHHIIDPETLMPSTKFKSVTVILDDLAYADALSTALFIKDLEEGKALAEKYGAEVFWIDNNDNEYKTKGYEALEKK